MANRRIEGAINVCFCTILNDYCLEIIKGMYDNKGVTKEKYAHVESAFQEDYEYVKKE